MFETKLVGRFDAKGLYRCPHFDKENGKLVQLESIVGD